MFKTLLIFFLILLPSVTTADTFTLVEHRSQADLLGCNNANGVWEVPAAYLQFVDAQGKRVEQISIRSGQTAIGDIPIEFRQNGVVIWTQFSTFADSGSTVSPGGVRYQFPTPPTYDINYDLEVWTTGIGTRTNCYYAFAAGDNQPATTTPLRRYNRTERISGGVYLATKISPTSGNIFLPMINPQCTLGSIVMSLF